MNTATPIDFQEVRDFGDVLNVTFQFLRQNVRTLAVSLTYIVGPAVIGVAIGSTIVFSQMGTALTNVLSAIEGDMTTYEPGGGAFWLGYLIYMISGFFMWILSVLVINSYVRLYQKRGPGGFEVADVWRRSQLDLGRMLGVHLLLFLGLCVSMILVLIPCLGWLTLIVGGIYLGVMFYLIPPVIVQEDLNVTDTFRRCFRLVKGNWWSTFGVLFVAGILASVLSMVIRLPSSLVLLGTGGPEGSPSAGLALTQLITFAGAMLAQAIPNTAVVFQYFSLVEQKDRTGLVQRVEAVGPSSSPATPGPSAASGQGPSPQQGTGPAQRPASSSERVPSEDATESEPGEDRWSRSSEAKDDETWSERRWGRDDEGDEASDQDQGARPGRGT